MKKIIFFQNILTPYRISFFEQLVSYNNSDIKFEVFFMSKSESGRFWEISLVNVKFPYRLGKSLYLFIRKYHFHFNPFLLLRLFFSKNEIVLMGAWNNFNNLIIIILKRMHLIENKLHIWSEANYYSARLLNNNAIVDKFRDWVLNTIDGSFLVPGQMAIKTLNSYSIKKFKYIVLPNLINDEKYVISQAEINQRLLNIKPIVIIPARLNEGTKGLIRYFENLGSRRVNSVKFYILGEGDDRQIIEDYINENNLNVELCGHVAENEIIGYYKKANLFVLPSITDPSPLSIVEACFMHLPLLVSSRCGNHYEAVNETLNGKIFDPFNKESVQQTFDQIIDLKDKWYEMGEESFNISKLNFNNKKIIQNLIYSI